MNTTAQRLARLEENVGKGCPRCAYLKPLVRVEGPPEIARTVGPQPERGEGVCPHCGFDRMVVVQIVLVTADVPAEMTRHLPQEFEA